MKFCILLACMALASAVPFMTGYQHKTITVDEFGRILVASQGWKVMVQRPTGQVGHVEVVVTGDGGYHRHVVIDHQFQMVKDSYLDHEYQFHHQFSAYSHVGFWNTYYGGFDQMEHLNHIFTQYIGYPIEQQVWHQLLYKLFNEVQHGKVHYVIYEIFMNFGQGHHGYHHGVGEHFMPNYQWANNEQYQTIDEHIQYARDMYHMAQRTQALFEQYGPEHYSSQQGFNHQQHLQYAMDLTHAAQMNLQYLLALQQNPEFQKYGFENPWYGRHFGQEVYGQQYHEQYPVGYGHYQQHYGMDSQYQYVQNRIHYIRWQLINFHHKSQEIYHQQQLINDQITQLQSQVQHQGDYQNPHFVDQVRALYHQLGMLTQQQVTLQMWIQQLHSDLDVQVHHWKQVHHGFETYPEHHIYGQEYQQYNPMVGHYQQPYSEFVNYQQEHYQHQQPFTHSSFYPSTWSKRFVSSPYYPSNFVKTW